MMLCKNFIQVDLILHGFPLHVPHFTQGLLFCRTNSHYVMHYMFSSLYTIKRQSEYSIKVLCFTLHLEKQKSRKVRASLLIINSMYTNFQISENFFSRLMIVSIFNIFQRIVFLVNFILTQKRYIWKLYH